MKHTACWQAATFEPWRAGLGCVAQWQSARLITGWPLVRTQPHPLAASPESAASVNCHPHAARALPLSESSVVTRCAAKVRPIHGHAIRPGGGEPGATVKGGLTVERVRDAYKLEVGE